MAAPGRHCRCRAAGGGHAARGRRQPRQRGGQL